MEKDNSKELLIDITTSLINEYNGEVSKVTIREIASKSGVSVGLINYLFGNKDNLIAICVQKIILNVVTTFKPNLNINLSMNNFDKAKQKLKETAKQVFEFLFNNKSIAKISILNDYANYNDKSNSNITIKGFMSVLNNLEVETIEKEKIAFYLTCTMQVAFIRSLTNSNYLGYDFNNKIDRDKFIDELIDKLLGGLYE
ncbi:MAG: TetR/AcrR family transcriptional regulator [bacterium]|nr:TetR/AcrR family transcriptional regulator [bacterium]